MVKWFTIQMPGTMVVWFTDRHLINIFRPPFEYWPAIQMHVNLNSKPFDLPTI